MDIDDALSQYVIFSISFRLVNQNSLRSAHFKGLPTPSTTELRQFTAEVDAFGILMNTDTPKTTTSTNQRSSHACNRCKKHKRKCRNEVTESNVVNVRGLR